MSKKVLAALLAVCMVASLLFVPAAAATFNDVDEDHWASGAIERWAGYGVLNGKDAEAGIFDPSAPMTRAEFAKMLVEMLGLTAKSDATFDDVDPEAWYADVVSIAVKAGIISGRPGNKFDPTAPVTFEEAAVMMCRAFGLAQVTSGAEWAKESIEKLTSLGMIGEGADEHLQVGVDCDRAVVAALADAVVKEYVNEDREEPITGEVNGVVLVVKGAKVEIKDATVSAPIVVESAEVTLTGTKAEDVKVSGKDAAIVADEASTVASVTLAGEAPKADIKGEVASVTIAEETTGAVVDAPKADPDTIVNNSTEEATVNGETVEGKPAETTDPTEPEGPGSVNGNDGPEAPARHQHTFVYEATNDGKHTKKCSDPECDFEEVSEACTLGAPVMKDSSQHTETCSLCGYVKTSSHSNTADSSKPCECGYKVTITEDENAEEHEHVWVEDAEHSKAATCAKEGVKAYKCEGAKDADQNAITCNATKTEPIAKLTTHTWDTSADGADSNGWVTTKEATCGAAGTKERTCSVCGKVETGTINATGIHTYTQEKYQTTATGHKKVCDVCGTAEANETQHNWKDGVCQDCKYECKHPNTKDVAEVAGTDCQTHGTSAGKQCTTCNEITAGCVEGEGPVGAHSWSSWDTSEDTSTRSCETNGCGATETCVHPTVGADGVCTTCSKSSLTPTQAQD